MESFQDPFYKNSLLYQVSTKGEVNEIITGIKKINLLSGASYKLFVSNGLGQTWDPETEALAHDNWEKLVFPMRFNVGKTSYVGDSPSNTHIQKYYNGMPVNKTYIKLNNNALVTPPNGELYIVKVGTSLFGHPYKLQKVTSAQYAAMGSPSTIGLESAEWDQIKDGITKPYEMQPAETPYTFYLHINGIASGDVLRDIQTGKLYKLEGGEKRIFSDYSLYNRYMMNSGNSYQNVEHDIMVKIPNGRPMK